MRPRLVLVRHKSRYAQKIIMAGIDQEVNVLTRSAILVLLDIIAVRVAKDLGLSPLRKMVWF